MLEQIGPYRVAGEIGRGGMGVVYRAQDERLGRAVAIKALPAEVAGDATRLERFEREARAMASVNHPNVAGIYGIEEVAGETGGTRFLAMELVEGETLGDRLDRGAMGVDEALELCVQIAAGVEAAHEAGVVHRDLKPSNIKITPGGVVKVLDFGLAKGDVGGSTSGSGLSQAATLTTPVGGPAGRGSPTAEGQVLGTAAYMSPEQARGRGVDKRTDVWAFGVILYECLTGVGPFVGETATDSIGAVLHKQVDLDRLPRETPGMVRHVLGRCLERDKSRRFRDIGDVRIELERAREEPLSQVVMIPGHGEARSRSVVSLLGWVAAVMMLAFGAALYAVLSHTDEVLPRVVRSSIVGPEGWEVDAVSLSPDGRIVAMVCDEINPETGSTIGDEVLFVRNLDEQRWTRVEGSLEVWQASFSPDGRTLAFLRDHPEIMGVYELMRVPSDLSRPPIKVCELDEKSRVASPRWFTWTPDGELVFMVEKDATLRIVDAGTGQTVREVGLTGSWDETRSLTAFGRGFGEQWIVVGVTGFNERGYQEDVGLIDLETGERRTVVREARVLRELPDGDVAFGRGETIYRSGWDWETLRLKGELESLQSGVLLEYVWSHGAFDVTSNGDLSYMSGGTVGADRRIVTGSADGVERVWGEEGRPFEDQISLSDDGSRFAVIVVNPRGTFEVWAGEVAGDRLRRLYAREDSDVMYPNISSDGEWVYVTEAGDEQEDMRVMRMRFDGSGRAELLWEGGGGADFHRMHSVHRSGRWVLFSRVVQGRSSVVVLDAEAGQGDDGAFEPMVEVMPGIDAGQAQFDPIGVGVVAYTAAPSGGRELFVRTWDPEEPGALGPVESVSRDFDFYAWATEPAGEGAEPGTQDRLFLWELSLQDGFTRTEVTLDGNRVRLGEREKLDRPALRDAVTGDLALDGTEIIVRRGESEELVTRVELVQGLLGAEVAR